MRIKKLELQGFKSFPDKTRVVLHKGITAIIGPNGTGKSNIVDALLWVLGGKRLKSLRGEHRGDIIFNGNSHKAPMGMADVTLTLTDEEEEMLITHRLFRSGESEYRLDGKATRRKDIQEALWKRSIGESDYFVIEQGAVSRFLSSKPQEKRSLLEEAAGTSLYKDKKRLAQNKLKTSEQNLVRLDDIIAEVARAKNSLKRQASSAIRYRKLREDIRRLESLNFRKKIETLESSLREITLGHQKSKEGESILIHQLNDEEKRLNEERQAVWNLENRIKTDHEELYELRSRLSKLEADKDREEKHIDYLNEKKSSAEAGDGELHLELAGLESEEANTRDSLALLSKELLEKQQELKKAEAQSRKSKEELDRLQEKIDSARSAYLQRISEHTDIKNEKARIDKEQELLLRHEEKLNQQLAEQKGKKEQEKSRRETAAEKLVLNKKKLSDLGLAADALQKEKHSLAQEIEVLHKQLTGLEQLKDKNTNQLAVLEKWKTSEQGEKEAGTHSEALGLLADFLASDKKHAHLVDVFWKEEARSQLIRADRFLKTLAGTSREGRFLLLHPDELPAHSSKALNHPFALGRLKTFVTPDPRIKTYFSHLKEAVITKDLKSAIELWIRFPDSDYITLNGDMLLSTGLLRLGDKKEGLFAVSREIKEIRQKIADAEKKAAPLKEAILLKTKAGEKLEARLAENSAEQEQMEKVREELEQELRFIETGSLQIQTNVEILGKELEVLIRDKKDLQERLNTITSRIDSTQTEEATIKESLEREEKNLASNQDKAEQERRLYFELKSQVELVIEKISGSREKLELFSRRRKTIEDKKLLLAEDIKISDQEIAQSRETLINISQEISKAAAAGKDKENRLHIDETQLKEMQAALSIWEEKLGSAREKSEKQKESRVSWEIKKAELDRDLVNLEESCWQELRKTLDEVKTEVSLEDTLAGDIDTNLQETREKLQKYSSVNLMAEEEYFNQKKRYDFLIKEQGDLRKSIETTHKAIRKIDRESRNQFLQALEQVNINFKDIFSLLFEGGHAEVKLSDTENPQESGVEIIAQPPGKRVQNLSLLSGGEKSLASLAFFFALFRYKPAPFCILDEVDAALDEVNLSRFLNLMKKIKEKTQFLLITHNFKTMEVADFIYGTTMAEPSATSLYSVKLSTQA